MKTFILASLLALTGLGGVVATSQPADAQTPWYDVARGRTAVNPYVATGPAWVNIARQNPTPMYQPYRGYYGAKTYIGQHYPRVNRGRVYSRRGAYHRRGAHYRRGAYYRRSVGTHRSVQRIRAIGAAIALIAILARR
jgi:hypothetical protein